MTDTFRAAYWISHDREGQVLLTGREHATLSDDRLLDVARAEMVNAEITEADCGDIVVGMWGPEAVRSEKMTIPVEFRGSSFTNGPQGKRYTCEAYIGGIKFTENSLDEM